MAVGGFDGIASGLDAQTGAGYIHTLPAREREATGMVRYDCSKCPGYCCSYPQIAVRRRDVVRLAAHFGLPFETAQRRFTREAYGEKWVLRRKPDVHFGRICRFFDVEHRRCTIYTARPDICRAYPNETRCGYYDFLKFERRHQEDQTFIAVTDSEEWT